MSQQSTGQPPTDQSGDLSFPSLSDLQNLRQLLKKANYQWAGITNAQRWHYHAYDYAFLRVRHGLFNKFYPLDPDGKWFHLDLIEAAERIYRPRPKPYSAGTRPADTVRDPELSAHFRAQDAERDALKRQVQVHGEREANGEPTPEMLAFMACCVRQVDANGKIFTARSRKAFAPEARMTQAQINAAMGVSATERKPPAYEDPDALRRGRVELGLEEDVFAETNAAPGGSR
jgi:hypothetical protein